MQRPSIDGLNTYVVCKAVHEAGFKSHYLVWAAMRLWVGTHHFRFLRYLPPLRALDKLPGQVSDVPAKALARAGLASESKLRRLLAAKLANQLAAAELFVLATRTRSGRASSGEGFGLVLLEAQVAGTPVIAPAMAARTTPTWTGYTGFAPTDESAGELTKVLEQMLADPGQLAEMGNRAAEWARECFAPEQYAPQAVARLL